MDNVLKQPSKREEVVRVFGKCKHVRDAFYDELDPPEFLLPYLVARNILTKDHAAYLKSYSRQEQVVNLLELLQHKDHEQTLAAIIYSLRKNYCGRLAKLVHDEWHGENDPEKRLFNGCDCLPPNPLVPELLGTKPKISVSTGQHIKGSIEIKNIVHEAFQTTGGDINLMIDKILLGAESVSADYYSVMVQLDHNSSWPKDAIVRYYEDALDSKLLIMHINVKYYDDPKAILMQKSSSEDVSRVLEKSTAVRIALTNELDPKDFLFSDLLSRNMLMKDEVDSLESLARAERVANLLKILQNKKNHEETLAVIIYSLRKNGCAILAKQIHDEWHGENDPEHRSKHCHCLPYVRLIPEGSRLQF